MTKTQKQVTLYCKNITGTKIPIPPALLRKPVFGDREQIAAIYKVEHILDKLEKEKQGAQDGDTQYSVTISFSGETTIHVTAGSVEAAEQMAREEFDINDVDDFEFDGVHARVINKDRTDRPC